MAAAAVLLFFQLVCGSLRLRSNNAFIQGGLWVAYTLLPPLVTYTLGLMQSSQVTLVIMYPVWALSLFLIAGGVLTPSQPMTSTTTGSGSEASSMFFSMTSTLQ